LLPRAQATGTGQGTASRPRAQAETTEEADLPASRLVTLTTDFGSTDHFLGTMRGVILAVNPAAQVVDLCNAVNSFDVLDGAMTIAQAYRYFPTDTIHLVVVDPGVGTARRPLLVKTERHYFIAPDNGVLSLVMEKEERVLVRHITATHYFSQPVSNTFHGRDVFAPCAGWLSKGVEPEKFGDEITDYVRFALPRPKAVGERSMKGVVLKVDKFGNLITNLDGENAPGVFAADARVKIRVGQMEVTSIRGTYAEGQAGEVFGVLNSMGLLEIACNRGSATQATKAGRGAEVVVEF
jgi:S-adenosyl-L-methionine hydrolase (adenosine-forming)